jgi:CBS domain-containing protein
MNRELAEIVRKQKPVCLGPNVALADACHQMHRSRIGAILITDADGKLIGIFTGRDAVRCIAEGVDMAATCLEAAMTRAPASMTPGLRAIDALRLMHDGGFRHVPVVEDGRPVGVVSRGDFRGLEFDRLDEETGLWERIA